MSNEAAPKGFRSGIHFLFGHPREFDNLTWAISPFVNISRATHEPATTSDFGFLSVRLADAVVFVCGCPASEQVI